MTIIMDKPTVVHLMTSVPNSPGEIYINVESPDIYNTLMSPMNVLCEESTENEYIVKSKSKIIFVEREKTVYFIAENVEKGSKLTIEVMMEHIDHRNMPILPCKSKGCNPDYVFKVKNPTGDQPAYELRYLPGNGEDCKVEVTFLKQEPLFRYLPVTFYCSASHKFQNNRFRLMFESEGKIVGMYLVEVTTTPKRSSDTKSQEIKEESEGDNGLDSGTEDSDEDSVESRSRRIKKEPTDDEEETAILHCASDQEKIKQFFDEWQVSYKVIHLSF